MPTKPELHRGILAKHPRVLSVRALVPEDLKVLQERRVGAPRIKSFRESHHRVARLIASGLRNADVSRLTGYSTNRIGQLKEDPSFEQLIAEYRGKVDERWLATLDPYFEAATENMLTAEALISDRLAEAMDDPEVKIPLQHLVSITADRADRFGYGKHSTQTNEVVNFAEMMSKMAAKSGRSNVIDATPNIASGPVGTDQPTPSSQSSQVQPFVAGGFRRRIQGRQE